MKQARIFQRGEGDAWFSRNRERLNEEYDPVVEILKQLPFIKPSKILEIGCSNGHRLLRLGRLYNLPRFSLFGIEPSAEAVANGLGAAIIDRGTADKIAYRNDCFDMVIFGFCLYLVDRPDLFKAVSEADRVLKDNGHLIILDFPPSMPYKLKYKHKDDLWSYHMDYPSLFLANPAYRHVMNYSSSIEPYKYVSVLEKRMASAYPEGEP